MNPLERYAQRMTRLAALALSVAVLAGCSAPTSDALDLRAACDELAVVQSEFGKVAPDAERFAEYAPKVRAVVDRAEDGAADALEPLAQAMEEGDVWALAGVAVGIQGVCSGAGSTGWS